MVDDCFIKGVGLKIMKMCDGLTSVRGDYSLKLKSLGNDSF